MPMSRVLILLVFTVSSITALGQAQPASRPSRPVAIDLSHINALNRNVVAADFNGDGIIDLAGSDISSSLGIPSTGVSSGMSTAVSQPASPTLPPGNVSSVSSAQPVNTPVPSTVASGAAGTVPAQSASGTVATAVPNTAPAANVAVFGNSVTVPNATVRSAAATVPSVGATMPGNVAVFGSSVTVPNSGISASGASFAQPGSNVAVIGSPAAVPSGTSTAAPVNGSFAGTVPTFATGVTTPGMAVSTPTYPAAVPTTAASTAQPFVPANAAVPAANSTTAQNTTSAVPVQTSVAAPVNGAVATANGTVPTGADTGVPVPSATPTNGVVPTNPVPSPVNGATAPSDSVSTGTNQPGTTVTSVPSGVNSVTTNAVMQPTTTSSAVTMAGEAGPVLVMLGVGDGTFRAPIRAWISGDVLAAGDFNGDKKMDLLIAQPDNQVLVLQGKGDGTFLAAYPVAASNAAQSATSGAAQSAASSGTQSGTSAGGAATAGGASSTGSTAASSGASSGASTNGSTPAAGQPAASTSTNPSQAVGTTASASGANTTAPVSTTQSNAVTSTVSETPTAGTSPTLFAPGVSFAAPADLDGDGRLDVVIGSNPEGVRVFRGLGDFTFDAPVNLVSGQSPANGVVADLNGDGKKDVAVANRDSQSVSVFLSQAGFVFTASDMPLDRQANDVAAGDVNGDGKVDLVVAVSSGGDGETQFADGFDYVLIGRGDGTFAQPAPYQVPAGAWRVALGDFNGDGAIDIATANRSAFTALNTAASADVSDTVSILPGNGDGTFGAAAATPLADATTPTDSRFLASVRSLSTADVNGDQKPDLVVSGGAILTSRAAVAAR